MGSFLLQFVPTGAEKILGTISSLIVMKRASRKNIILPDFVKRNGLVPVVVSDKESGRVLMLGYTDKTAFLATNQTGEAHFYSTSRKRLWKKGESSGNILLVHEIRIDSVLPRSLLRANYEILYSVWQTTSSGLTIKLC